MFGGVIGCLWGADDSENLRGGGTDLVGVVGDAGRDVFLYGKLYIDWLDVSRLLLCDWLIGTTRMCL